MLVIKNKVLGPIFYIQYTQDMNGSLDHEIGPPYLIFIMRVGYGPSYKVRRPRIGHLNKDMIQGQNNLIGVGGYAQGPRL